VAEVNDAMPVAVRLDPLLRAAWQDRPTVEIPRTVTVRVRQPGESPHLTADQYLAERRKKRAQR